MNVSLNWLKERLDLGSRSLDEVCDLLTFAGIEVENLQTVGVQSDQIVVAEIKEAVQQLFSVRVTDVRTMVVRGKNKRFGRHFGKRSNWKKALVTVAEGDTLDFYSGL